MTSPAPYPANIRAKGWRFELDHERIKQSTTWAIAKPEDRPWLLMMWMTAWEQTPCGSLEADEEVIAARIGMPPKMWAKCRAVLMRGWWKADDGRLYHPTMTERVLEMTAKRRSEADRKAQQRARNPDGFDGSPTPVPRDKDGTGAESDTGTGTGTYMNTNPANAGSAVSPPAPPPPALTLVTPDPPKGLPDCPHRAVLALWAEVLPALPQHNAELWRGARADHLRARWRETAAAKGWTCEAEGLTYFRRLFAYVGQSAFLAGRARSQDGRPPFVAELAWLVKPENWAKTIEGKYHAEAA